MTPRRILFTLSLWELALVGCSNNPGALPSGGASGASSGGVTVVAGETTRGEVNPAGDAGAATDAVVSEDAPASGGAAQHYRAALVAYGRNDFVTAAREFEAAFEARPSAELAFNAGRMHERMASAADATRWYERVLAMNPDPARRADVTHRIAALQDYDRRRREDFAQPPPGTDALQQEAAAWFARGIALYRRRRYADALRAFEAAQQFTASAGRVVPELVYNLAVTHEHLGHRQEAVSAFRAYLSERPDSVDHEAVERRLQALASGR
jgi:tetratricopeptide (TPR) repeat protein